MMYRYLLTTKSNALLMTKRTMKFKPPKMPQAEGVTAMWEKATKPAREIFHELSQKSPQLRNQVYIPLGNVSYIKHLCIVWLFKQDRLVY